MGFLKAYDTRNISPFLLTASQRLLRGPNLFSALLKWDLLQNFKMQYFLFTSMQGTGVSCP